MRLATLGRRSVLAGLGGFGATSLAGCVSGPMSLARPGAALASSLPAVRAELDRITRVTVCLRPFRKAGPRLDVERVGDKTVVHNYGHGGSGWSLSWGSAEQATRKALADGARDVAVIGCGALGLTTATVLRRAGANVTIYAAERLADTRSSRATGTWSPDSRIAAEGESRGRLSRAVGDDVPDLVPDLPDLCRPRGLAGRVERPLQSVRQQLRPTAMSARRGFRTSSNTPTACGTSCPASSTWPRRPIRSRSPVRAGARRCSSTSPSTPTC
ncbi:FAD-dependent oxidoreductase [Caulobacter segnis]